MELGVERRDDGYWELVLAGAGTLDTTRAQEQVAALARELTPGAARPAFLLWNLSSARELPPATFAWMMGASALHRLHGIRVFVCGLREQLSTYLAQLGIRGTPGPGPVAAAAAMRRLLARKQSDVPEATVPPRPDLDRMLIDGATGDCQAIELYRWRKRGPADLDRSKAAEERAGRARPSLGEILLELGVLTRAQLDDALVMQRHEKAKGRLGNLLVRMGLVSDEQIFSALEEQYRRGLQRLPSSGSDWKGQARDTRESLLGNVLLSLGILSSESLDKALQEQWATGGRETLGAVLIRLGLVTRAQLFRALEKQAELKARARRVAGAQGLRPAP